MTRETRESRETRETRETKETRETRVTRDTIFPNLFSKFLKVKICRDKAEMFNLKFH